MPITPLQEELRNLFLQSENTEFTATPQYFREAQEHINAAADRQLRYPPLHYTVQPRWEPLTNERVRRAQEFVHHEAVECEHDARNLLANMHFGEIENRFLAAAQHQDNDIADTLNFAQIQALPQRMEDATVHVTDWALYPRPDVFRDTEEQTDMAPLTATTATTTTQYVTTEAPAPPFVLQMNTQDIELRELREQQPREMLARDYQLPIAQGMQSERRRVTAYINAAQKAKHVATTIRMLMENNKAHYVSIFSDMYTHGQLRDMQRDDFDWRDMRLADECADSIRHYQRHKQEFLDNKRRFAPMQALYNQQVARIRQKPRTTTTIDPQRISDIVSQWENVWGVKIQQTVFDGTDTLSIRIGLCDIAMNESALDSRYNYAAEILLAPFYFTIDLSANGNFVCRSQNGNTRGLSRDNNQGGISYDIHPHQLSDSPCFGTFGQSFIDMARIGDMVSLIGGIIAFYSQYNSEDSAGVNAYRYHPANLPPPSHEYPTALITYFKNGRLAGINETKLTEAFNRYMEYHDRASREDPPTLANTHICPCCDERSVGDDDEFYITDSGGRVCSPCWENHYCSDCERRIEDCDCDPDDY